MIRESVSARTSLGGWTSVDPWMRVVMVEGGRLEISVTPLPRGDERKVVRRRNCVTKNPKHDLNFRTHFAPILTRPLPGSDDGCFVLHRN